MMTEDEAYKMETPQSRYLSGRGNVLVAIFTDLFRHPHLKYVTLSMVGIKRSFGHIRI